MTRRVSEAREGTGEAKKALKETGIALRDSSGKAKTTEQIFFEVADRMKGMESCNSFRIQVIGLKFLYPLKDLQSIEPKAFGLGSTYERTGIVGGVRSRHHPASDIPGWGLPAWVGSI